MEFNEKMIKKIVNNNTTDFETVKVDGIYNVGVIKYKKLNDIDFINNAFSTRLGGVSESFYEEMNLSYTVGDLADCVSRNFEIFGKAIGIKCDNMVYSHQTHTSNVMRITKEHLGMGITKERNFSDIDAVVTNEPGICLVTSYADCVPLYFVDTKNKAIGLSHSGWRGTVADICKNTIDLMKKEFGTDTNDLICAIGPSICKDCYEVSEDVANEFMKKYDKLQASSIVYGKSEGKYLLDLHMANYYNMINQGVKSDNISMPDICTCCNGTWMHSHRYSKGKRGGLCAFLSIK